VAEQSWGCLLIDGRSGAGKTLFAAQLAASSGAQTLHLEDLYPGWGGLAAGSLAVADALDRGDYRRYDWYVDEFNDARINLDPSRRLIIEGCGAITKANLAAAHRWLARSNLPQSDRVVHGIWLESPEAVRRMRALTRDGHDFAVHWQPWAEQENLHYSRHTPWQLADETRAVD